MALYEVLFDATTSQYVLVEAEDEEDAAQKVLSGNHGPTDFISNDHTTVREVNLVPHGA